jgi:hypothetical protein
MENNKNQPQSPTEQYPALALWRRRLALGWGGQNPDQPRTWILDQLWTAACHEAAAMEAAELGQHRAWRESMRDARRAVLGEKVA